MGLPLIRAFEINTRTMHYDFQFMYLVSADEKRIPSGIIFNSDLHTQSFETWPPEWDEPVKFQIMEYLHAKDSNGVFIYEYDVVKVLYENVEYMCVAVWGNHGCAICWDINKIEDGKLCKSFYFDKGGAEFTVVGNAFENPELVSELIKKKILNFYNE